uniref:C2 NT-type domain-containing protein n=1 Tax=Kalanchoe fedtschenkoi TaxID=63787 RepID=A0A7N1A6V8_KALFE
MVVKMMRWRPWPPMVTRKYEVRVCVRRLEGADRLRGGVGGDSEGPKLAVEIRWKRHMVGLGSLRRSVNRSLTKEATFGENGTVCWDEEFLSVCSLSGYKDNEFNPWEICFNLLNISMKLLESRITQESTESVRKSDIPVPSPSPPRLVQTPPVEKDELSALKAGLRKVRIFTNYVSSGRTKKTGHEEDSSEGRGTARSEDAEYTNPFDSDSCDGLEEGEYDDAKEENSVRKSFSYGTLAYANCVGSSYYSTRKVSGEDEDWVYFSHRKSDVGSSVKEDSLAQLCESYVPPRKRSILPWKRRKLNLRSPKAKGEPLLKEEHREEGGDDIDFDRRQLSSDESLYLGWYKSDEDSITNGLSVSEFGDDHFAIGSWEQKDITSRDGLMKLQTQVFFASIDQRSERAAGESACTALVAVIADWFQTNNRENFPIKSQFDSLIREGSLEWRRLCENDIYKELFPDKHFDLDSVLQAKIRPLTVIPGKSFIGFFHPEGMDEAKFGFLQGAMSFDGIWDEIERAAAEIPDGASPLTYIVSWNDHFFVLKVEADAYYIIDTLGERLYEGCNQAYILKFDRNTVIHKLPCTAESSDEKPETDKKELVAVEPKSVPVEQINPAEDHVTDQVVVQADETVNTGLEETEVVVCRGKESCKEYIKSMLTAIPIRELLVDIKKGLMASIPLHHRLQIEFHYTEHYPHPVTETSLTTLAEASEAGKVESEEHEFAIA